MYTFHKLLSAMQSDHGTVNFLEKFPYHWLRSSWYHYLSLLDIDYSSGFMCPKCDGEPTTVICDATALAFRRELLPNEDRPSSNTNQSILEGWY